LDVILEVLNLIVDSRVVEDLLVVRIMRIERTIERERTPRPRPKDPYHLIGQSEGVARHATAPAFRRQPVRRNEGAERREVDFGRTEEDSLAVVNRRFERARLGCAALLNVART